LSGKRCTPRPQLYCVPTTQLLLPYSLAERACDVKIVDHKRLPGAVVVAMVVVVAGAVLECGSKSEVSGGSKCISCKV
jgi:hypothetical protein